MKTPKELANEIQFVEGSLASIRRDLIRADLYGDEPWTVGFSEHILERLKNAESLLDEAKRGVSLAHGDAVARAAVQ